MIRGRPRVEGLMDALAGQSRIDYILALHEIPAMAMADGYAQATGSSDFHQLLGEFDTALAVGMGLFRSYSLPTQSRRACGRNEPGALNRIFIGGSTSRRNIRDRNP